MVRFSEAARANTQTRSRRLAIWQTAIGHLAMGSGQTGILISLAFIIQPASGERRNLAKRLPERRLDRITVQEIFYSAVIS